MHRIRHLLIDSIEIAAYSAGTSSCLRIKIWPTGPFQKRKLVWSESSSAGGSQEMTTGAQTVQSRQSFPGKADSQPPRQDSPTASPRAPKLIDQEWRWQRVFPQENRWINPQTKQQGRHHTDESLIQKAVRDAVSRAGLTKRVTCLRFVIPLRLTCSKAATTSALCKSF